MTAPNMVNTNSITGNSAVISVTTSPQALVVNPSNSSKVQKINCLIVSNVDTSNSASITVDLFRAGTAYTIVSAISVAPNTSFTPIDKTLSLYLLEGDSLRVTASANSRLQAVCSYEEIS
jgi:hypothetical protein